MKKVKVLHLIKSLGRGGAEMLLPETLKLHDQNRFEFFYIYFLPWKDQMVKPIADAGGNITCFSAKNNLKLLQRASEVTKFCKENDIDIIHAHLPWSGFLARLVHKRTKLPLVYTEHNIQEKYHFLTRTLNKHTYNYQTLALGVSNDVSQSIQRNIKPHISVKTLLNGVNTQKFKKNDIKGNEIRKKYGIPLDAVVVGNVAVFREQKAIPVWLKAFREISENYPEVYGLLVGAGPKEEEIRQLIREFKLEGKVKLPGLQVETLPYFSAMDIFMMSSAFEGLPIALLEAMSCECAVVSTKAGGVVEVVREGKDGLLSATGDWKGLVVNVQDLLINNSRMEEFKRSSRIRVEKKFSLQNMVLELEEIYPKLIHQF
ncbi:glycosyltransferase [Salinimicrobium sp. TH3]|uniref:glycosyltransferase n=1 Tax=Salinimicrobium sp. TH3 TaxID=2997342 RepID=UPI00227582F7|nr:glycosyltransferase [Salinimicrobium sp. TH3]MCY2686967.1 glycosyltransferase [Salinimicrobium sp. TH3]